MSQAAGAKKPWYVGLLGAVAVAVVIKLATPVIAGVFETNKDKSAIFDREVTNNPLVSDLMQPFKRLFPAEYEDFKSKMIAGLNSGRNAEQMRLDGYNYMQQFSKTHTQDLVQAPSAALRKTWDQQGLLLKQLRGDSVTICAHFSMKGIYPEDRPSQESTRAISGFAGQRISAISEGIRSPAGRTTKPTDADYVALFTAMQRMGLTNEQTEVLKKDALAAATAEDQCAIGILINDAVSSMRNEQGDRLRAGLLGESAS